MGHHLPAFLALSCLGGSSHPCSPELENVTPPFPAEVQEIGGLISLPKVIQVVNGAARIGARQPHSRAFKSKAYYQVASGDTETHKAVLKA